MVAGEVKDLVRGTATATQRVGEQVAALQASSRGVADGIHATSTTITQLGHVQQRITDVLTEQARIAQDLDSGA